MYVDATKEAELEKYKGKLSGAIVLVGTAPVRGAVPTAGKPDARYGAGQARGGRVGQQRDDGPAAGRDRIGTAGEVRGIGCSGRGAGEPPQRKPQQQRNAADLSRPRRRPAPLRPVRRQGVAFCSPMKGRARPHGEHDRRRRDLLRPVRIDPRRATVRRRLRRVPRPVQRPEHANPTTTATATATATGSGPTTRPRVWSVDAPHIPPQVALASEHYNRLVRMIQQGEKLKMAVDLRSQFHDDDLMAYNTVAEIPGTDLKDEVVMLGGHMDSWHSGTGATDNAAGVAVGDGGRAHPQGARPQAAPDDPHRPLERRGAGPARLARPTSRSTSASPSDPLGGGRRRRDSRGRRPAAPANSAAATPTDAIPSPSTRSSRPTSTSTTARARSAASTSRATRPCGRSSASGSSRSATWAPRP